MAESESLDLGRARRWQTVLRVAGNGVGIDEMTVLARRCLHRTLRAVRDQVPFDALLNAASSCPDSLPDLIRGCKLGRDYARLFQRVADKGRPARRFCSPTNGRSALTSSTKSNTSWLSAGMQRNRPPRPARSSTSSATPLTATSAGSPPTSPRTPSGGSRCPGGRGGPGRKKQKNSSANLCSRGDSRDRPRFPIPSLVFAGRRRFAERTARRAGFPPPPRAHRPLFRAWPPVAAGGSAPHRHVGVRHRPPQPAEVPERPGRRSRSFRVRLEVHTPEFWHSGDVARLLKLRRVEFVSGDRWDFELRRRGEAAILRPMPGPFPLDEEMPPETVSLYSGGLDSAAGLARRLMDSPGRRFLPVTVGHQSQLLSNVQAQLSVIWRRFGGPLSHIAVPAEMAQPARNEEEKTQRSRSFLFACVGGAVAAMSGSPEVEVYESGIGAVNCRSVDWMVGSRATKSSHPHFLRLASGIVSRVAGRDVTFRLPFLDQRRPRWSNGSRASATWKIWPGSRPRVSTIRSGRSGINSAATVPRASSAGSRWR